MQESINFGIEDYENVEPNLLNTDNASDLLHRLPQQIDVNTFLTFALPASTMH